jgi:VWFA-related protein
MKPFLLTVSILAANGFGPERIQDAPQTRSSAPRLRIDAIASNRDGSPVDDLRRDDLEVWINHYRVPIESITMATRDVERNGRLTVLVLDNITTAPTLAPRVREVASQFVRRIGPGDEMSIVALDGDFMKSTDDRAQLLKSIDAYSGFQVGVMPFDRLGEHVLTTVAALSRQLAESPGRKTIVCIGSGWLFDTPIAPPTIGRDLRPEWVDAMRAIAFANATLYVIDPGGVGSSFFAGSGSSGFARETGGFAFLNTNNVNGAVDRIMQETASYYVIEVPDPPVGRKADLRELELRVLRRGVTARARRWLPGK